jgi:hypothetical protein
MTFVTAIIVILVMEVESLQPNKHGSAGSGLGLGRISLHLSSHEEE